MKNKLLSLSFCLLSFAAFAQNVGIGTTAPEQKLDVVGRLRIRHTPNQTAGIFLDGDVNTKIGFVGVCNNNTVGLYGSVSGWQFVMNTDNGNVGIGTTAPTAKLDVAGTLRLRGSLPANGAVLVSQDGNGNTAWQRNYAFRAAGLVDFGDETRAANSNSKLNFHYAPIYNLGLPYNGQTSTFTAPVKGVYMFSTYVESYANVSISGSISMYLMLTRNNTGSTLASSSNGALVTGDITVFKPLTTIQLHGDFLLEAGDQVWVKASNGSSHTFYGAADKCAFSGHLVSQVF